MCIPVDPSVPFWLSQCAYLLVHLSHFDCLSVHTCWSICPSLTVSECIPVVPSAHFVSVYVPVGPSIPLCLRVHTCWSIYFTCWSIYPTLPQSAYLLVHLFHIVSECIPVGPSIPLWPSQSAYLLFHLSHFILVCIPVVPSVPFVSVCVPVVSSVPLSQCVYLLFHLSHFLSASQCAHIPVFLSGSQRRQQWTCSSTWHTLPQAQLSSYVLHSHLKNRQCKCCPLIEIRHACKSWCFMPSQPVRLYQGKDPTCTLMEWKWSAAQSR